MIIFIFLGVISSIFQLTILREFTFSIAKNELSLVVAVGFWLLFCSLGSLAATKSKAIGRAFLAPLFSMVFCLSISASHLLKLLAGLSYYEAASLGFVVLSALAVIGPMSFLTGYSFSVFSRSLLAAGSEPEKIYARFFIYEAIGFFLGGFIFTFFLSSYSNPFYFCFLPLLFLPNSGKSKLAKLLSVLFIALLGIGFISNFSYILAREVGNSDIVLYENSGYGPLIVAKRASVESVYANGSLVSSSEDEAWDETFIHSSFSAHPNIRKVLFIGLASPGQLKEILKYPIASLDCVDINPLVLNLTQNNISKDKRAKVNFLLDDPYSYIRNSAKKYDCIIMNMPAPSSISLNRYFSYEFFNLAKKHLTKKGVFSFYIPSKRDILSPRIAKFNSCIVNTVNEVFNNRLLIPSDSMIIIAGNSKTIEPTELVNNFNDHSVSKDHFTVYHLDDLLDPGHRDYIENSLDRTVPINRNLNPQAFLYYLLLEQAKFYPNFLVNIKTAKTYIVGLLVLVIVGFAALSYRRRNSFALLNVTGLGASAIGFITILFILFQIYSGALFWKMGIIVGIFMLGLSLGAYLVNTAKEFIFGFKRSFAYYYLIWIVFIVSLLVILEYYQGLFYWDFSFYIYSSVAGLLTGAIYPLAAIEISKIRKNKENIPVAIYAADLSGAFLGTFLFSVFFIPFLGLVGSLIALIFILAFFSLQNLV